jgi:hypothetical protein
MPGPAPATPAAMHVALHAEDDAVGASHSLRLIAPGDFVVYRFSGTLRPLPMTLTERVVAQEGDVTVIDFALQEGKRTQTLRVRMGGSALEPRALSAALVDGGVEGAVSTDAYEALLARTVVAADRNDGLEGTQDATIDVDGKSIRCTKRTYRVSVGKRRATMSTLETSGFTWGDVGGEIRADDGALLYRAEVVHAGNGAEGTELVARSK